MKSNYIIIASIFLLLSCSRNPQFPVQITEKMNKKDIVIQGNLLDYYVRTDTAQSDKNLNSLVNQLLGYDSAFYKNAGNFKLDELE